MVMAAARVAFFCLLPVLHCVGAEPGNCEAAEGSNWQKDNRGPSAKALMQAFTTARQATLSENVHASGKVSAARSSGQQVPAGDLSKFGGGGAQPPAGPVPQDLSTKMGGGSPQPQPQPQPQPTGDLSMKMGGSPQPQPQPQPTGDLSAKMGGGSPQPQPQPPGDLSKKMGGGSPQQQPQPPPQPQPKPQEAYVNPYQVTESQVEEDGVLEVHDGVAGDAAQLNEDGFQEVKQENNKVEMEHFIRRVIADRHAYVCDNSALLGLVHYYFKQESGNNFERLNEELDVASNSSCPWVGTVKNKNCSTDRSAGANASIDEPGYKQVKKANCFAMMRRYIRRVAGTNGFHICNEGGLTGLVHFYFRPNSDGNYSWLVQEITTASTKDCPWVVKNEFDCPKFLDKGQCSGPPTPASKPHIFVDEKEDAKANFTTKEMANAEASAKDSVDASAKSKAATKVSKKTSLNTTAPAGGNSSTSSTASNKVGTNNATSVKNNNSKSSASSTPTNNSTTDAAGKEASSPDSAKTAK